MIKRVVLIVEGINDEKQVKNAFEGINEIDVIVTEGTKVNTKIIDTIYEYINKGYTPYVLSDPDEGGLKVYEMIQSHFPNIERIEVDLHECGYCTGTKIKAGIEYSSHDYLRSIVYPLVGLEYKKKESPICWD